MDQIVVSGAREHNLKDVTVAIPAGLADRHHRPVRVRQVVAGLRHDLRRGPAPLRRVAVGLRPPVPGADGQARRRLDRGAVAGDLDRPEDDLAQPALDGRHGHRDLRLPAPAVGADRPSALPRLRPADHRPVGRADHRPGHGAARGHAVHGAGADRARAQGRVRQAVRGAAGRGLRPRQGQRRAAPARRGDRARQEVQARHRRRRRPAGDEAGPAQAAGRLDRDGGRARRRAGRDRARRRATARSSASTFSREVRLPRARAAAWSSSSRGSSRSTRPTAPARAARAWARRWRSTPSWSSPTRRCRSARARSRRGRRARPTTTTSSPRRSPSATTSTSRRRGRTCRRGSQDFFLYGTGGERVQVSYRNRFGRRRSYATAVRGDRPQPRAPLPRDRLGLLAGEDRGVHDAAAVPGLQGRAAAARVAGGARRRDADPRVHRAVGPAGAGVDPASSSSPSTTGGSPGWSCARSRSGCGSSRTSGSATCRWTGRRRRCRAGRPSGSGWRRRSARRWSACSTSSTSRRSACTSATTTS